MTTILQVFYSVFSAALLSMAIPNEFYLLGCPIISFFAIIPFYKAIKAAESYKKAFLYGFLFTISTHLFSSFWLANFKDFAIFTLGASAIGTGIIGAFSLSFAYIPFSRKKYNPLGAFSLKQPFYESLTFRTLYFSIIYTLYEYIKSSGFLGYPWGTISSSMFNFPEFMQLAAITGTYGITFLTVLFNCLIQEAFVFIYSYRKINRKKTVLKEYLNIAAIFLFLFSSSLLYGYYSCNKTLTPVKHLKTLMVQHNWNSWETNSDTAQVLKIEEITQAKLDELREADENPQLIVWNEGVLQRMFPGSYLHYKRFPATKPLIDFIKQNRIPLLTGGSYRISGTCIIDGEEVDNSQYFNSALLFDEKGNFRNYYAKLHLVPFAESIPGIQYPKIKAIMMKLVGISAGWTRGYELAYFDVPCSDYGEKPHEIIKNTNITIPYDVQKDMEHKTTVKISAPVCFDDAFTDVIRPLYLNGAELFLNLTDDSWSLTKSSEYQHFVVASYRAIEYRTTFARCTDAGYTVVLDPHGKILADLPLFEEGALYYDIPVYKRKLTTYARFGNWLPYSCAIVLILFSIYMIKSFRKTDYIDGKKKIRIKKTDTEEIVIILSDEDFENE